MRVNKVSFICVIIACILSMTACKKDETTESSIPDKVNVAIETDGNAKDTTEISIEDDTADEVDPEMLFEPTAIILEERPDILYDIEHMNEDGSVDGIENMDPYLHLGIDPYDKDSAKVENGEYSNPIVGVYRDIEACTEDADVFQFFANDGYFYEIWQYATVSYNFDSNTSILTMDTKKGNHYECPYTVYDNNWYKVMFDEDEVDIFEIDGRLYELSKQGDAYTVNEEDGFIDYWIGTANVASREYRVSTDENGVMVLTINQPTVDDPDVIEYSDMVRDTRFDNLLGLTK